jgi:hypothetical protein
LVLVTAKAIAWCIMSHQRDFNGIPCWQSARVAAAAAYVFDAPAVLCATVGKQVLTVVDEAAGADTEAGAATDFHSMLWIFIAEDQWRKKKTVTKPCMQKGGLHFFSNYHNFW